LQYGDGIWKTRACTGLFLLIPMAPVGHFTEKIEGVATIRADGVFLA